MDGIRHFNAGGIHPKTRTENHYEAYEDRYKTAHEKGVSLPDTDENILAIVMDIIKRYHLHPEQSLLEIGCGEGRDSATVLENGFHLIATDISPEAINYCKKILPDSECKIHGFGLSVK